MLEIPIPTLIAWFLANAILLFGGLLPPNPYDPVDKTDKNRSCMGRLSHSFLLQNLQNIGGIKLKKNDYTKIIFLSFYLLLVLTAICIIFASNEFIRGILIFILILIIISAFAFNEAIDLNKKEEIKKMRFWKYEYKCKNCNGEFATIKVPDFCPYCGSKNHDLIGVNIRNKKVSL